nr:hypothetical protein [uncultured Rhodopila sp.]
MTEAVTIALRERLARTHTAPLLFIGDDFGTTDVIPAMPPE